MEQLKKNRKRSYYRNYANEKLIRNQKNRSALKKLENLISMEVIEKEIIEKTLIKYFIMKRNRTFYRNFINRKLLGNLGKRYRRIFRTLNFNYEKISPDQIMKIFTLTRLHYRQHIL